MRAFYICEHQKLKLADIEYVEVPLRKKNSFLKLATVRWDS